MILGIDVVEGGAERADSVEAALARVKPEADFVCVHDAARPCLADVWIDQVFRGRPAIGRGDPRHPGRRTRSSGSGQGNRSTRPSRAGPLGSRRRRRSSAAMLLDAYAQRGGFQATDDAQLVERLGRPVTVVLGSPVNIKITTHEDLRLAEQAMKALPKPSSKARPIRSPTKTCGGKLLECGDSSPLSVFLAWRHHCRQRLPSADARKRR